MAWVPIAESGLSYTLSAADPAIVSFSGSSIISTATAPNDASSWDLSFDAAPPKLRITASAYQAITDFGISGPCFFQLGSLLQDNLSPTPEDAFQPSPFEIGPADAFTLVLNYAEATGSEWSVSDAYEFLIEVELPDPPPPVEICQELGRETRAYVSGYQRDRIHRSRLVRGEKRCLVANYNGAIPAARSIVSAIWRCQQPYCVAMSNARIDGREVTVNIAAQLGQGATVKCEATLDNGEVYTQLFVIDVLQSPWFNGEIAQTQGPYELAVTT